MRLRSVVMAVTLVVTLTFGGSLAFIPRVEANSTGGISGVITDTVTGTPIAGAMVSITSYPYSGTFTNTYTNAGGGYEFSGLNAGTYIVSASDAFHHYKYYGNAATPETADIITVSGTSILGGTNFSLWPIYATLRGTIYEQDGTTPITGRGLLYAHRADNPSAYSYTTIQADGTYALVLPTDYAVTSAPIATYRLRASPRSITYFYRWYGNTATFETATDVIAQSGLNTSNLDISLGFREATFTPTFTPSNTPTFTPTFTASATATFTPSATPTSTYTPTPTANTLSITVTMPNRSAALLSYDVKLVPQSGGAAVFDATVNSDADGVITILGMPTGAMTLWIKFEQSISSTVNLTLLSGDNLVTVDIPMIVGDANGDNLINILDFSLLAVSFGKVEGEAGYNPVVDFDGNGIVNILDFSILASNFGQAGAGVP